MNQYSTLDENEKNDIQIYAQRNPNKNIKT